MNYAVHFVPLTSLAAGNVTGEPEIMSDKDQREAGTAIDVFGLPLVSKAYSKTWSFREDALLEVYKHMSEMNAPSADARSTLRAAVQLIAKETKDPVFSVRSIHLSVLFELRCLVFTIFPFQAFKACVNLLRMVLVEFIPRQK